MHVEIYVYRTYITSFNYIYIPLLVNGIIIRILDTPMQEKSNWMGINYVPFYSA